MAPTIIVGIDGKPGGVDALALARRICPSDGEIVAVAVGLTSAKTNETDGDAFELLVREEAHDRLSDIRAQEPALRTEVLLAGSVATALHAAAAAFDAKVLVIGACRRGPVGRFFLGDDARETLRGTPCPVAVSPRDYALRDLPIRTIGVGLSDDAEGEAALAFARVLAAIVDADLHALSVVNVPTWPVSATSPTAEEIEGEIVAGTSEPADVEVNAVPGSAVDELRGFGDEVDLLVVGSHQRRPLERWALGSVSEVLGRGPLRPLVVVPCIEQQVASA